MKHFLFDYIAVCSDGNSFYILDGNTTVKENEQMEGNEDEKKEELYHFDPGGQHKDLIK